MECEFCSALLVDAFVPEDDGRTDPIQVIGGQRPVSAETDELLRAAREVTDDDPGPNESLERVSTPSQYTGDLPRLFRFGNRYQILEKLGEGGMGRVYKALDLELDRAVALKTIRTEKGSRREVLERFKQELVLARKVTHKNVIRIYDLGEYEGMKFFTMELVEGASLRDVLNEKHKVPVAETLSLMRQMLSGLGEAHSQGVVHRDLKPQNIMVDGHGIVRIMDFGIARTADSATMTGTGEMMGTPDYISPEQVKGETADAQSDLYSFGVILYELLTGETPFTGDTPISRIVARIQTKPPSPRESNPEIPTYLERIILKCLEVDPDLRYHSAEEVLEDLTREQVDSSLWLRTKKALSRRPGWVAAACLVGALGVGIWYDTTQPPPKVAADSPTTALAVLPFQNVTDADELAWMEIGIPEMLITDISQSPTLRPVTAARITQILRDLGKEGQSRFDEETLAVVSEMADVDVALHGRFVEAQGQLRLDLVLRDSRTGVSTPIQINGPASQVFSLVDAITVEVAQELDLEAGVDRPIHEVSTASLGAFRAYHQGLKALHSGANQAAVPLFQEAIEEDSGFAMAHARLAEAFFHLGNTAAAREAIAEAEGLAQIAQLPRGERYEVHAIAARIDDDPETAVESYRELVKLYPSDPGVLYSLASSLETLGEVAESIDVYRKVLVISPDSGAALLGLGRMLVVSGSPGEAIPLLRDAMDSGNFDGDLEALGMIHSILGFAFLDMGRLDEAVLDFERSIAYRRQANDRRGVTTSLTNLATAQRELGRRDEARKNLEQALALATDMGNKTMESLVLLNIGNLHMDDGALDEALLSFRRSLDIEWERGEHTELAMRVDAIASALRLQGLHADAQVYLEYAEFHLEHSEDAREKALNLMISGEILRALGSFDEAREAFLDVLRLYRDVGSVRDIITTQLALSELYTDQGRFDEALAAVDAARTTFEAHGVEALAWRVHVSHARVLLHLGAGEATAAALSDAESALAKAPLDSTSPMLDLLHAESLLRRGMVGEATERFQRAIEGASHPALLTTRLDATIGLGKARARQQRTRDANRLMLAAYREAARRDRPAHARAALALAESSLHAGELDGASRYAKEALELFETFGTEPLIATTRRVLGRIAEAQGRARDAKEQFTEAAELTETILAQTPEPYRSMSRRAAPWAEPIDPHAPRPLE